MTAYARVKWQIAEPTRRSTSSGWQILLRVLIALVWLGVPGCFAQSTPPAYKYIVVFGDSLCDTGNDAQLSATLYTVNAQIPGPATDYTNGRFTDGADTSPAARIYTGVWLEQLAAKFTNKPSLLNSLSGGTNYAYGFATTNVGTTVFTYGPGNALAFTVENMGQQISDYLATNPVINSQTLFVVWGGANDLINATSSADIVNAATRDVALVQRLITAGATDILVPNLPPLGLVPRFNGSATTSAPATAAAQGFDQALAAGLAALPAANPGKTLRIYPLDTYTLFNTIVGPPVVAGFANVTASSQGNTAVNPDTYLFWDSLHPTTYGHSLLASTALTLLGTPIATTTAVTSSNANANLNSSVTFTASVTGTSGTPMGTVTFLDGTTAIGTGLLSGSSTVATASISTSSLAAGTHSITASYAGVNGYVSSTSPVLSQIVVAPAYSSSASPSSLTISRGATNSTVITLTPVGGYVGNFTLACGTLPADFSCTLSSTTLSITNASPVSTSVTLSARAAQSLARPVSGFFHRSSALVAFAGLPILSCLAFSLRRRGAMPKLLMPKLLLSLLLLCTVAIPISGCGNPYANDTPVGTYSVPILITPAGGQAITTTISVTVQ